MNSNDTFKWWSSGGFAHILPQRFHLAVWLKLAKRSEFSDGAAAWKNERDCPCWPPWKAQAAESTDSLLWEALRTSSGSCSSANAIWTRFAEWWSSWKDKAEGAKGCQGMPRVELGKTAKKLLKHPSWNPFGEKTMITISFPCFIVFHLHSFTFSYIFLYVFSFFMFHDVPMVSAWPLPRDSSSWRSSLRPKRRALSRHSSWRWRLSVRSWRSAKRRWVRRCCGKPMGLIGMLWVNENIMLWLINGYSQ